MMSGRGLSLGLEIVGLGMSSRGLFGPDGQEFGVEMIGRTKKSQSQ